MMLKFYFKRFNLKPFWKKSIQRLSKLRKSKLTPFLKCLWKKVLAFSAFLSFISSLATIAALYFAFQANNLSTQANKKSTEIYKETVKRDSLNQLKLDTINKQNSERNQKQLTFLKELIEQNNILSQPQIALEDLKIEFSNSPFNWVDRYNHIDETNSRKLLMTTSIKNVGQRSTYLQYLGIVLNHRDEAIPSEPDSFILKPSTSRPIEHIFILTNGDEYNINHYCIKIMYLDTLLNRKVSIYKIFQFHNNIEEGLKYNSIFNNIESKKVSESISSIFRSNFPQFGTFQSNFESTDEEYYLDHF